MNTDKHTEGAAYIETAYNKIFVSVDDWQLCEVGSIGPQNTINAERIKTVWNAHDELVKACSNVLNNLLKNKSFGQLPTQVEINAAINVLTTALQPLKDTTHINS